MYTYNNSGEKVPTVVKNTVMKFADNKQIIEGFSFKSKNTKIFLGIILAIVFLVIGGLVFLHFYNKKTDGTLETEMASKSGSTPSGAMNFGGSTNRFGFRFY